MKGEAAAWFESTKENWNNRYDEEDQIQEGDNTTGYFTTDFKARFITD